jgi:hypothetical protein
MPRLKSPTGVVVNVDDAKAKRLLSTGYKPAKDEQKTSGKPDAPTSPHASKKVDELRQEIAERNADREDDAKIPSEGNKPDLIEALDADDAKQAAAGDGGN